MTLKIRKYNPETGRHFSDELQNYDVPFWSRHRTLLGKILLQLNALKRRRHVSNNARWEILPNYHAVAGWTAGTWNPVKFAKEILRGDFCRLTTTSWIFRAQTAGTYLIQSNVTIVSDVMQSAVLGLFVNGNWYSNMRVADQPRIYDLLDDTPAYLYNEWMDLSGGVDQVFLNIGDEVEIKCFYVSDVSGGDITKIVGYVNIALIGDNERQIQDTVDTWGGT